MVWVPFIYFSFLIVLFSVSSTMLNKSNESRHDALYEVLEEILQFFPMSPVGQNDQYCVEEIPFYANIV
jgi:hypothetical protein